VAGRETAGRPADLRGDARSAANGAFMAPGEIPHLLFKGVPWGVSVAGFSRPGGRWSHLAARVCAGPSLAASEASGSVVA